MLNPEISGTQCCKNTLLIYEKFNARRQGFSSISWFLLPTMVSTSQGKQERKQREEKNTPWVTLKYLWLQVTDTSYLLTLPFAKPPSNGPILTLKLSCECCHPIIPETENSWTIRIVFITLTKYYPFKSIHIH